MTLFGFLNGKKQTKGTIGYFGLENWWLSSFSEEERKYIENRFQPLGSSEGSLTSEDIKYSTQTAVSFLQGLAGWFMKAEDRYIAYRILEKAEELSKIEEHVLDIHFLYSAKSELYYKDRDKPQCLEKAINACKHQIALAPKAAEAFRAKNKNMPLPSHKGYEQLAIILEKQMSYKEAIDLCSQAEMEGWAGNWGKRIDRCKKKMMND